MTIPAHDSEQWKGVLIASNNYSFQALKVVSTNLPKLGGSNSQNEISRMYEFIADRSLNALYKMFFRYASPSFYTKELSQIMEPLFYS